MTKKYFCGNIKNRTKVREVGDCIVKNKVSKELFNLVKQLNDEQVDILINHFRQEKSEEHEGQE